MDWRGAMIDRLAALRLTLHEQPAQMYPVSTGIPFLGFRIYPESPAFEAPQGRVHFGASLHSAARAGWKAPRHWSAWMPACRVGSIMCVMAIAGGCGAAMLANCNPRQ